MTRHKLALLAAAAIAASAYALWPGQDAQGNDVCQWFSAATCNPDPTDPDAGDVCRMLWCSACGVAPDAAYESSLDFRVIEQLDQTPRPDGGAGIVCRRAPLTGGHWQCGCAETHPDAGVCRCNDNGWDGGFYTCPTGVTLQPGTFRGAACASKACVVAAEVSTAEGSADPSWPPECAP